MIRRPSTGALLAYALIGGVLLALSQGQWAIPIAAWLAPAFLVRFMRHARLVMAVPLFVIIHVLAWEYAYLGMVPMPTAAHIGLFTGLSLVLSLVFLLDRRVASRSASFLGTLVLPCGWVAFELANALVSPAGTWGSIAYTFVDQSALVQLASITGWTGLTFLVAWTGSVVNWALDRDAVEGAATRRGLATCAGVVVLALLFGSARLAWPRPAGETFRAALVVAPGTFDDEHLEVVWAYTRGVEIPPEQVASAQARIARSRKEHFDLVERELGAGARVVAWAEANAVITTAEEPAWIKQARELARRESAYIGLGLMVFRPAEGLPTQNKFVLVGPDGAVVWEFLKATRVPGSSHVVGDGVLPVHPSPLGTMSTAICFDMDFPRLIGQVGRADAAILLAPSNDWEEVRETHARMAVMRAVEQGVVLVRPTKDGISLVTDSLGRIVARLDTTADGDRVLAASVPTRGMTTIYSRIGDTFSWICVAGFVLLPIGLRGGRAGVADPAAA